MFIQVDYRLESGEYVRGMTAAFRRGTRICAGFIVFAAVLLAVMYGGPSMDSALSPPRPSASVPVAAVGLYYLAVLCLRRPRLRRRFRTRAVERVVATFTESGASWHTWTRNGEHSSEVTWSAYTWIRETPELFLLYSSKKAVTFVPKRVFDAQSVELFSRFAQHGFPQARTSRPVAAPEVRA